MYRVGPILVGLVVATAAPGEGSAFGTHTEKVEMDAQLGTSGGGRTRLSGFRGKPVVLFFEDRDSPDLNKAFKDQLFALGKARDLLTAAHVVAVANLSPFDFFPARQFALAAVRREEARWGIPILVDWDGVMAQPPWRLPQDTSSVLLLDSEGRIVYQRSGALDAEAQRRFFEGLAELLGVPFDPDEELAQP